jgi:hypothetical protein
MCVGLIVSVEEDMALTKSEKESLERDMELLILKERWKLLKVIPPIILVLIGIIGFVSNNRFANIETRLTTIDGHLFNLRAAQSPEKVIEEFPSLDQKTFQKSLVALRTVSDKYPSNSKPDPNTITQISEKLRRTNESTPEYWPALLQFLTFASAVFAPPDVPPPGVPHIVLSNISNESSFPILGTVEKKIVLLDGWQIANEKFIKCRIMFTQNAVKLRNVTFINCVFEMPVTNTPTPFLKDASRRLLASDLKAVSIPMLS